MLTLKKNPFRYLPGVIVDEFNLGIHDFQEELGLDLGEEFNFSLSDNQAYQALIFTGDCKHEIGGSFVLAYVGSPYFFINRKMQSCAWVTSRPTDRPLWQLQPEKCYRDDDKEFCHEEWFDC